MPDFFGARFNSSALKVAASIIVFIFLVPYTASLYNGLSRLFGMSFGIDYTWCVIGMAVLTGIYVLVGGYMATAVNDFIQGMIMLVGIVAVILSVLNGNGADVIYYTVSYFVSNCSKNIIHTISVPVISQILGVINKLTNIISHTGIVKAR